MNANALLVHLRRPITAIGLFVLAAILIIAGSQRDGPRAQARAAPVTPTPTTAPADESSTQALVERGTRALELGRYDEAIVHLRAALDRDPDSAVAHNLLGMAHRFRFNALRARRDKEREIEAFREAVRLDPTFVQALVNLGTSLWWDGRGTEALPHLLRALALDPYHPDRDNIARMMMLAQGAPPTAEGAAPTATPPTEEPDSEESAGSE